MDHHPGPAWRAHIAVASLNPFRGYATALSSSLPHAVRVLDAFHVVRLGQTAVDDVRRRVQQETLGRRGHRDAPLYRARRLLRRGFTTLTDKQWAVLEHALVAGDRSGQLTQAWMAAQELQLLYCRSRDLPDAQRRLWAILDRCAQSDVPELLRLARTLDAWRTELLAAFTPTGRRGVSNGPTEAINALIKKVKRVSGTASGTWTTTACGCFSPPASTGTPSPGKLPPPPRSEAAHHASWRRAGDRGRSHPVAPRVHAVRDDNRRVVAQTRLARVVGPPPEYSALVGVRGRMPRGRETQPGGWPDWA